MTSRNGLVRGVIAASLIGCAAYSLISLTRSVQGGPVPKPAPGIVSGAASAAFKFVAHEAGWVDEFEHFAARHKPEERNVVVVAKAVPGDDAAPDAKIPETIEPRDVPKPSIAAGDGDALLTTGSLGSQRQPLLPPVPGPDAFKVEKGDRLGATQRLEPALAPGAMPPAPDAAGPHAEIAPIRIQPVMLPAVKSAMLLPARTDKLKPVVVSALRPLAVAPARPDALFQGPPMPGDPTQDPDAPVLGYAEQMSSAEAPFQALFAVTPADRHSWLAVDQPPPKAKATKPTKVAHAPHRHSRHRDS